MMRPPRHGQRFAECPQSSPGIRILDARWNGDRLEPPMSWKSAPEVFANSAGSLQYVECRTMPSTTRVTSASVVWGLVKAGFRVLRAARPRPRSGMTLRCTRRLGLLTRAGAFLRVGGIVAPRGPGERKRLAGQGRDEEHRRAQ